MRIAIAREDAFGLDPERLNVAVVRVRQLTLWGHQARFRPDDPPAFFGARDLRELREADFMAYIAAKVEAGRDPRTIRNDLSILRRVLNLLVREGALARNPASGVGEMLRRVRQAAALETEEGETWSRTEVATLLAAAREQEVRFSPLLALLFATGMRRGEALGLQWADADFDGRALTVRRSVTKEGVTTPKSGRARKVPMTQALAEELFNVLVARKDQPLRLWKGEVPPWVFASEAGGPLEPRNVERSWIDSSSIAMPTSGWSARSSCTQRDRI